MTACLFSLWPRGNYVDLSQFDYDISHAVKVVCYNFLLIYCIVSKPFCIWNSDPLYIYRGGFRVGVARVATPPQSF